MDKLKAIVAACKGEVSLTFNEHRTMYQYVEDYLVDFFRDPPTEEEAQNIKEMVEADTIIRLQMYDKTPVGFYLVMGTDLDEIIDRAYNQLVADGSIKPSLAEGDCAFEAGCKLD